MHCIKTGFTAYLSYHGEMVYGDAFALVDYGSLEFPFEEAAILRVPQPLLLRVCERSVDRTTKANILVHKVDHWFDENIAKGNSTLIVLPCRWDWLSYSGTEFKA